MTCDLQKLGAFELMLHVVKSRLAYCYQPCKQDVDKPGSPGEHHIFLIVVFLCGISYINYLVNPRSADCNYSLTKNSAHWNGLFVDNFRTIPDN